MALDALLSCGCRANNAGITQVHPECFSHRVPKQTSKCGLESCAACDAEEAREDDPISDPPKPKEFCETCGVSRAQALQSGHELWCSWPDTGVHDPLLKQRLARCRDQWIKEARSTTVDASTPELGLETKTHRMIQLDCGCRWRWSADWSERIWQAFGCPSHYEIARDGKEPGHTSAHWDVMCAADPRAMPPIKQEYDLPPKLEAIFKSPSHYNGAWTIGDFIEDQGLSFLEGNVVKYVCRWRKKDGVKDLKKALHYLERLIERAEEQKQ